jgi:IclR family transcriptional regulator, KDG regulon repressor
MKTVDRVINLLEVFLESNEEEITVSEMARLSGLNKSTTNRMALTLVKRGYLNQSGKRGKYSLGMKFRTYYGVIKKRSKLGKIASPFLDSLSQDTNETVVLVTLDNTEATHFVIIPTNQLLKTVPDEGTKVALYSTGVGKAILAKFSEKRLEEYSKAVTFRQKTPNTITNINDLKKHLLIVKRDGVAFDDEEESLGVRNIAAAINDQEGNVIGSVGVLGPTIRLSRSKLPEIALAVKKCAQNISASLGYRVE